MLIYRLRPCVMSLYDMLGYLVCRIIRPIYQKANGAEAQRFNIHRKIFLESTASGKRL